MSDDVHHWPANEDERRLQRFRDAMRDKWGLVETPAAEVYAAFDGRVVADVPGFEAVAPGRHVRRVDPDIVHLLRLARYKDSSCRVQFGAVLTFMPVEKSGALRRADLGTRIVPMLWDEPPWRNPGPPQGVLHKWSSLWRPARDPLLDTDLITHVDTLRGRGGMEFTLQHHWQVALPLLRAWFSRNATLGGLLETAREQCAEPGHESTSPNPRLVMAFLLARLGREAEALATFEAWQRETPHDELQPARREKLLAVAR